MSSSAAIWKRSMKSLCLLRSRTSPIVACSTWWPAWTFAQALTGDWPTSTAWQRAICGTKCLSALIDRPPAPAILKAIDPRQRERIDDKAQRGVGRKVERDGEHGADRAGMHDEDGV